MCVSQCKSGYAETHASQDTGAVSSQTCMSRCRAKLRRHKVHRDAPCTLRYRKLNQDSFSLFQTLQRIQGSRTVQLHCTGKTRSPSIRRVSCSVRAATFAFGVFILAGLYASPAQDARRLRCLDHTLYLAARIEQHRSLGWAGWTAC